MADLVRDLMVTPDQTSGLGPRRPAAAPWDRYMDPAGTQEDQGRALAKALLAAGTSLGSTPGNFLTGIAAGSGAGAKAYYDTQESLEDKRRKKAKEVWDAYLDAEKARNNAEYKSGMLDMKKLHIDVMEKIQQMKEEGALKRTELGVEGRSDVAGKRLEGTKYQADVGKESKVEGAHIGAAGKVTAADVLGQYSLQREQERSGTVLKKQGMQSELQTKLRDLINLGNVDVETLKGQTKRDVEETKQKGATGRTELQQAGATGRANITGIARTKAAEILSRYWPERLKSAEEQARIKAGGTVEAAQERAKGTTEAAKTNLEGTRYKADKSLEGVKIRYLDVEGDVRRLMRHKGDPVTAVLKANELILKNKTALLKNAVTSDEIADVDRRNNAYSAQLFKQMEAAGFKLGVPQTMPGMVQQAPQAPAAPQAPQAPQPQQQGMPERRMRNPQTGAVVIFRNGQWVDEKTNQPVQ